MKTKAFWQHVDTLETRKFRFDFQKWQKKKTKQNEKNEGKNKIVSKSMYLNTGMTIKWTIDFIFHQFHLCHI